MEAKPHYIYHPKVANRLFQYNPNLKLIFSLRNPVERAFSAWTMYHHNFKTGKYVYLHDPRSFSGAVTKKLETIKNDSYYTNRLSYVKRGIYHLQIEKYLTHFKREQLLIIDSKKLESNPVKY